jgi:NADPH2:quinone reductase
MRAVVLDRFGGPEVLQLRDIPAPPEPGPGQILVRVHASGTNPVDAKLRQDASWAGLRPPLVLGYDASGVVERVGPGVTDFARGDEVYFTPEIFGTASGTYAELTVVPAAIVARKPRNLSHVEASAVPLAGGTAYEAIVRRLQLTVGETILIHGGAGGVGSFAVQIAKAMGARVIATAGREHQGELKRLGAHVALDYRQGSIAERVMLETEGRGVDATFDTVGKNVIASFSATRPFGRVATILGASGDLTPLYMRNLTLHGVFLIRERKRLDELRRMIERGQLSPVIDRTLPMEKVSDAHRRLDSGHGRGKIVLDIAR